MQSYWNSFRSFIVLPKGTWSVLLKRKGYLKFLSETRDFVTFPSEVKGAWKVTLETKDYMKFYSQNKGSWNFTLRPWRMWSSAFIPTNRWEFTSEKNVRQSGVLRSVDWCVDLINIAAEALNHVWYVKIYSETKGSRKCHFKMVWSTILKFHCECKELVTFRSETNAYLQFYSKVKGQLSFTVWPRGTQRFILRPNGLSILKSLETLH
jgi:hypothetical protein